MPIEAIIATTLAAKATMPAATPLPTAAFELLPVGLPPSETAPGLLAGGVEV